MKIILANPRGFCAGVRMAVDVIDLLVETLPDEQLCVYHEIVHNRHVVERFQARGVVFVEAIADVPDGAVVVFSAHGVSPLVRAEAAERGLTSIDATCPLVTKVHAEAIRYARRGWQILLVGHAEHQEVVGTHGEAPDAIQIVESEADIESLDIRDPEKLVYLTQTTLSIDEAKTIIAALHDAFPAINSPPSEDICYATTNRQRAVREIAPSCDLVLVVGSRNSSNSVRLKEIAERMGTPAKLIDDHTEQDDSWFENVETILVTAGASAPDDLVNDLVLTLAERFGADVEQWELEKESIEFRLPASVTRLLRARDVTPPTNTTDDTSIGDDLDALLAGKSIPHRRVDLTVRKT
jgi:4-hydroxy-3-methylbut-2-enyl diphosphate reductase